MIAYDDWQSFVVSDLGQAIIKEYTSRVASVTDRIQGLILCPLSDSQREILNALIVERQVCEGLLEDFEHGYFGFVDDLEIDKV